MSGDPRYFELIELTNAAVGTTLPPLDDNETTKDIILRAYKAAYNYALNNRTPEAEALSNALHDLWAHKPSDNLAPIVFNVTAALDALSRADSASAGAGAGAGAAAVADEEEDDYSIGTPVSEGEKHRLDGLIEQIESQIPENKVILSQLSDGVVEAVLVQGMERDRLQSSVPQSSAASSASRSRRDVIPREEAAAWHAAFLENVRASETTEEGPIARLASEAIARAPYTDSPLGSLLAASPYASPYASRTNTAVLLSPASPSARSLASPARFLSVLASPELRRPLPPVQEECPGTPEDKVSYRKAFRKFSEEEEAAAAGAGASAGEGEGEAEAEAAFRALEEAQQDHSESQALLNQTITDLQKEITPADDPAAADDSAAGAAGAAAAGADADDPAAAAAGDDSAAGAAGAAAASGRPLRRVVRAAAAARAAEAEAQARKRLEAAETRAALAVARQVGKQQRERARAGGEPLTDQQVDDLIQREYARLRPGRAESASQFMSSQATECGRNQRAQMAFQVSTNSISWLYGGPGAKTRIKNANGGIYCYLCSLIISDLSDAHFEHVLPFLSSLAKGLIPVTSYNNLADPFQAGLFFVQSCLGEWAHHHCNSTCKREDDLTNNKTRVNQTSWVGWQPSVPAIQKILWCIWNGVTRGKSNALQRELRRVYVTYGNFERAQLPKIFYRVEMSIHMVKCFVPFDSYQRTKGFLFLAGNAALGTRFRGGQSFPIGKVLTQYFSNPAKHPVDWQKALEYLNGDGRRAGRPRIYDVGGLSGKMFLETQPLGTRVQSADSQSGIFVHPAQDWTTTHGGRIVGLLDDCGSGDGDPINYSIVFSGKNWTYNGQVYGIDARRHSNNTYPKADNVGADDDGGDDGEGGGGGAGGAAAAAAAPAGGAGSGSPTFGGSASSASMTRRRQRKQELRTQKAGRRRRRPHVTVEIVPYQP